MNKTILSLLVFGFLAGAVLSGQTVLDPEKGFTLENEYARYIFEPRGLGLSGMVDRRTGFGQHAAVHGKARLQPYW